MPLIKNVFKNSNITSSIDVCQSIKNKGTSPCFKSLIFFLINILPILHPLNMLIIIMFFCVHMNRLGSRILIPFSKSVALSKIAHLLFATTFNSHLSISIAFCCAFAIAFIFVDCCTSTYTSVDGYISA